MNSWRGGNYLAQVQSVAIGLVYHRYNTCIMLDITPGQSL